MAKLHGLKVPNPTPTPTPTPNPNPNPNRDPTPTPTQVHVLENNEGLLERDYAQNLAFFERCVT